VRPETIGLFPIEIATSALAKLCPPPPQTPCRAAAMILAGWSIVSVE
jgi:hypothetical protein